MSEAKTGTSRGEKKNRREEGVKGEKGKRLVGEEEEEEEVKKQEKKNSIYCLPGKELTPRQNFT